MHTAVYCNILFAYWIILFEIIQRLTPVALHGTPWV